jgi:hypothetical protein
MVAAGIYGSVSGDGFAGERVVLGEIKAQGASSGRIRMGGSVRGSLIILRVYLLAMFIMLGYHLLALGGAFGHGAGTTVPATQAAN